MQEVLLALVAGFLVGVLFSAIKLPIPRRQFCRG